MISSANPSANYPDQRIAENLAAVRERMAAAAARAGRQPSEVRLVAVTKYVGPAEAAAVVAAGCHDLGESRPQELARKHAAVGELLRQHESPPELRWHMIGHVQRNKARLVAPHVALLHSCDSPRLLVKLEEEAALAQRQLPVLLEVNISVDAAKHGFAPADLERLLGEWPACPHLEVRGLMGMASLTGGQDQARRNFAALRELRDRLQPSVAGLPGVVLRELSMGMSGDFEVAIEEGATIVRVGSSLFEGLES